MLSPNTQVILALGTCCIPLSNCSPPISQRLSLAMLKSCVLMCGITPMHGLDPYMRIDLMPCGCHQSLLRIPLLWCCLHSFYLLKWTSQPRKDSCDQHLRYVISHTKFLQASGLPFRESVSVQLDNEPKIAKITRLPLSLFSLLSPYKNLCRSWSEYHSHDSCPSARLPEIWPSGEQLHDVRSAQQTPNT